MWHWICNACKCDVTVYLNHMVMTTLPAVKTKLVYFSGASDFSLTGLGSYAAPYVASCQPSSLHVCGCYFWGEFLEGPLLGTSEDVKPL